MNTDLRKRKNHFHKKKGLWIMQFLKKTWKM